MTRSQKYYSKHKDLIKVKAIRRRKIVRCTLCGQECDVRGKHRLCRACYEKQASSFLPTVTEESRRKISNGLRKARVKHSAGYWLILVEKHPRACKYNKFGESYVYEHILIAEKALGRFMKGDECVHHINGDKSDNRNCNLIICKREFHKTLHNRASIAYGKLCVPKKEN